MMLGYDWPRLHAALNDAPAALLPIAILFDLAGTLLKRPSLRTVGLWTLLTGTAGTGAAVIAGLLAEGGVQHSDEAHMVMERHEWFALAALGVFAVLSVWRVARRGEWGTKETPYALGLGAIGVALVTYTAHLGGALVFDHALGVPTDRLGAIRSERLNEDHEHATGSTQLEPSDTLGPVRTDSGTRAHQADSTHRHADAAPPPRDQHE